MLLRNKVAAACASTLLALSMTATPALAEPSSNVDEARQAMTDYGNQLAEFESTLATSGERLEEIKQEIGNTETQVNETNEKYQQKRGELSDRMRTDYKDGNYTVVDILFGSQSLSDFISRLYYFARMNAYDIDLMNQATTLHDQLMTHKAMLEAEKSDCEDTLDNVDAKIAELTNKLAEAQSYFNSLPTNVQETLSNEVVAQIESGNVATNNQGVVTDGLVSAVANVQVANVAQSAAAAETTGAGVGDTVANGGDAVSGDNAAAAVVVAVAGGGTDAAADSGNAVANSVVQAVASTGSGGYSAGLSNAVDKAYSVIGTQYTYGGMSVETGFDCSGLVNYAYGGDRGRSTYSMINSLQNSGDWKTSLDQLQYGDLVFPSEGHVGIYIGDGQMIHSPSPGRSVEVTEVYDFYGGGSY